MVEYIFIRGLDALQRAVSDHADEIDYCAIDEVVRRGKCVQFARVEFTEEALADWLEPDEEEEEEEEEGSDEAEEQGGDTDDEPPLSGDLLGAAAASDDKAEPMGQALFRWIYARVAPVMRQRPSGRFKLRLHSPKGGYVFSRQFSAENTWYSPRRLQREGEPEPSPLRPGAASPQPPQTQSTELTLTRQPAGLPEVQPLQLVPAPRRAEEALPPAAHGPAFGVMLGTDGKPQFAFLDPHTIPEARAWRALGNATERLLDTMGASYAHIINLQSTTVNHQAGQLDKAHRLIEALADKLIVARQAQHTQETEQKSEEGQLKVRQELGKTFLSELGAFGRLVASSKLGVAPELAELAEVVTSSPELAEAIRDPEVRAMLKDEQTRKELAQLLLLASKKGGDPPKAA